MTGLLKRTTNSTAKALWPSPLGEEGRTGEPSKDVMPPAMKSHGPSMGSHGISVGVWGPGARDAMRTHEIPVAPQVDPMGLPMGLPMGPQVATGSPARVCYSSLVAGPLLYGCGTCASCHQNLLVKQT